MRSPTPPIRVLLAVPTPPPFSGPEINGAMLLRHGLGPGFATTHLNLAVRGSNRGKGAITAGALVALVRLWGATVRACLRTRPRVLYLYLAQNRTGFFRDMVVILTARLFGARVVGHMRGGNFANYFDHASRAERVVIKYALGRLAIVVLLAERFRPQMTGLVPAAHLRVVYNAVDDESLDALRTDRTGRTTCTVMFMGHLSVAKGFGDLVDALPRVLDACPGVRMVAAGEWLETERNILFDEDGRPVAVRKTLRRDWEALCARFGDRVTWAGVLGPAEKVRALADADLFVLPSYSEGFPMAALEAMAAGLPLVVTPAGALAEILEPGTHAIVVSRGEPAGLADAVIALASDAERRCEMGRRNRALVEERFTFARVVRARLETILHEAATAR